MNTPTPITDAAAWPETDLVEGYIARELELKLTAVTEQRDRLMQVIESATILIAAKGRHNTMLAYNGLRDALQSLDKDHFPDVGNMIATTTTKP